MADARFPWENGAKAGAGAEAGAPTQPSLFVDSSSNPLLAHSPSDPLIKVGGNNGQRDVTHSFTGSGAGGQQEAKGQQTRKASGDGFSGQLSDEDPAAPTSPSPALALPEFVLTEADMRPMDGLSLYEDLRRAFQSNEDVSARLKTLANGSRDTAEVDLKRLNNHLDACLVKLQGELVVMKGAEGEVSYEPLKKAYDEMWAYHQELNNRIEAGRAGRILHGYGGWNAMSGDDLVVSSELTFRMIYQLKHLRSQLVPEEKNAVEQDPAMAARNAEEGRQCAARVAHCEKTKLLGSLFMAAMAAAIMAVAVATVVVLLSNPVTAPATIPVAIFLAKFQVEAIAVAGLYLLAEFANAVWNKWHHQPVLPESKKGKVALAVGAAATVLEMAAPAVTSAFAGVNPATVALSSATAEIVTGNATVVTASSTGTVMSLLMVPAALASTAVAMMTRAALSAKRAWDGEGDTLRQYAEKAFGLAQKQSGAEVQKSNVLPDFAATARSSKVVPTGNSLNSDDHGRKKGGVEPGLTTPLIKNSMHASSQGKETTPGCWDRTKAAVEGCGTAIASSLLRRGTP